VVVPVDAMLESAEIVAELAVVETMVKTPHFMEVEVAVVALLKMVLMPVQETDFLDMSR
jgi:hypothetical protein